MIAIQPLSDLHIEGRKHFEIPYTDSDVIVLAGDIHKALAGLRFANELSKKHNKPVIYVAGNHEFYDYDYDGVLNALREDAADYPDVHFLEQDEVILGNTRFLGATLWSDYKADSATPQVRAMGIISMRFTDHKVIRRGNKPFLPKDALAIHEQTRSWLNKKLSEPFNGKTVVVTHHGPSLRCRHKLLPPDVSAAGYISNVDDLVEKADLWIYGHTHSNYDDYIGKCRLLSNQAGYNHEGFCPDFKADLVIELGD